MFCSALSFSISPLLLFRSPFSYFVFSPLMSSLPDSLAACDLYLTPPHSLHPTFAFSSLSCSFSNTNLCAALPGCPAQCEACVISSRVLLEQIPQGLNRLCYILSPLFFCLCHVYINLHGNEATRSKRPLRNVDAFFLKTNLQLPPFLPSYSGV